MHRHHSPSAPRRRIHRPASIRGARPGRRPSAAPSPIDRRRAARRRRARHQRSEWEQLRSRHRIRRASISSRSASAATASRRSWRVSLPSSAAACRCRSASRSHSACRWRQPPCRNRSPSRAKRRWSIRRSRTSAATSTRGRCQDLPVNGRNFMDLTLLAAGSRQNFVAETPAVELSAERRRPAGDPADRRPASASRVSARTRSPEFEVITNRFDARQGRSTGIQVNAITKSGTNTPAGIVCGLLPRRQVQRRGLHPAQSAAMHRPAADDDVRRARSARIAFTTS